MKYERLTTAVHILYILERSKMFSERSKMISGHSKMFSERSKMFSERSKMISERSKMFSGHSKMISGHSKMFSGRSKMISEHSKNILVVEAGMPIKFARIKILSTFAETKKGTMNNFLLHHNRLTLQY
jgi:hypothetical protein